MARTGAGRRPAPRSSAARMPATAVSGRPASRAAPVIGEVLLAGALVRWPDRPPGKRGEEAQEDDGKRAAAAREHQRVRLETPGRVERANRPDRCQRGYRDGAAHRQHHPADDGGRAVQADRQRGLAAGCPDRAHGGHVGRREVQQLRQRLRGEHQQRQRRQSSEDGQRDRLRLDGLLGLLMDDVQAADVEAEGACRYVELAVQRVLRPSQPALQRRDPGCSRAQPQPYPRERELPVQVPGGGRGWQEGTGHLVELVHEHGRLIRDRGDHKRRVPGHCDLLRLQIQPAELVRHPSAHPDVQIRGQLRGDHDLVGRARAGQLARHDGDPVLPEELTVETPGNGVGDEGVVHPAVHDRIGAQAQPGCARQHTRQPLDLADGREGRPGTLTYTSLESIEAR